MSRRSQRLISRAYYDNETASTSDSASLTGSLVSYKESTFRIIKKKGSDSKRSSPHHGSSGYSTRSFSSMESSVTYSNNRSSTSVSLDNGTTAELCQAGAEGITAGPAAVTSNTTTTSMTGTAVSQRSSVQSRSSVKSLSGTSYLDSETSSSSEFQNNASRWASLLWSAVLLPGNALMSVYWWLQTTPSPLLDNLDYLLHRLVSSWKKVLLLVLAFGLFLFGVWYISSYGVIWSSFSWPKTEINQMLKPEKESEVDRQLLVKVAELERLIESLSSDLNEQKQGEMHQNKKLALMQKELDTFRSERQKVLEEALSKINQRSQELQAELQLTKPEFRSQIDNNEKEHLQKQHLRLGEQLTEIREELKELQKFKRETETKVKSFPNKILGVQEYVQSQLPDLVRQILFNGSRAGESDQSLTLSFFQQEEVQAVLQDLERKILANISRNEEQSSHQTSAAVGAAFEGAGIMGVTEKQVNTIVDRALRMYSEDRIGLVDYALESAGASVLSTRCSETYESNVILLSLFGIPLWYRTRSPDVIIQPDVNPGNCWAFRGSRGFVMIQLAYTIKPTAFTLEHIPKSMSTTGSINSAPRDFAVYGIDDHTNQAGTLLGQFTYNQDGNPIQTFFIQTKHIRNYRVIEMRVQSNWGHPEYTCIYRFRVHGDPVK